jgi:hypothetical protein
LLAWESGVVVVFVFVVLAGAFVPGRDTITLIFVAGVVSILSLFVPRIVNREINPTTAAGGMRWVSLVTLHGAVIALALPLLWDVIAPCVGWARAAVGIGLLPVTGVWIVIVFLLAALGLLVDRGIRGFACAAAFVGLLWIVSA